jgi:polycomb protein EED
MSENIVADQQDTQQTKDTTRDDVILEYNLEQIIIEEKNEIYSIRFCDILPFYYNYFVTAGSNCASIYEINEDNNEVKLKQAFVDEDLGEIFYASTWGSSNGAPLVIVGGERGIIKIINCCTFELDLSLLGHGNAVNDLRIHPVDENMLLSCSTDESIRLWNISKAVCIAIFAGNKGHRDNVLSIDFHPLGNCFASAGMDTSIKIWNLEDPQICEAISNSYTKNIKEIQTLSMQIPIYSTTQIHSDFVDSVRWVGNCIISKSTKNRMVLWAPDSRYSVIIYIFNY